MTAAYEFATDIAWDTVVARHGWPGYRGTWERRQWVNKHRAELDQAAADAVEALRLVCRIASTVDDLDDQEAAALAAVNEWMGET